MNIVCMTGRTTRDLELRRTNSDIPVCNFVIAVQRQKKDDPADFINCIAWNKTAEVLVKYVKKGDKIGITGRLQTRVYKTKEGRDVHTTDVVVDQLEFLEPKKQQTQTSGGWHNISAEVEVDDDLPFN